jgi:hypothetical protein
MNKLFIVGSILFMYLFYLFYYTAFEYILSVLTLS